MARTQAKPTSVPAFYFGSGVPKAIVGDFLEWAALNGVEFDEWRPLFNFVPRGDIAAADKAKTKEYMAVALPRPAQSPPPNGKQYETVLKTLAKTGGPTDYGALADAFVRAGLSASTKPNNACARLVETGHIVKIKRGVYALAGHETQKAKPANGGTVGSGTRGGKMANTTLDALSAAYPGSITRGALKLAFKRAKLRPESCSTALHQLKGEGRVEFLGAGEYRLIPAAGEAHGANASA